MKQHPPDVIALVFGLAFAISGALILVTQGTGIDVGLQWGFAVVAIAVGAVTLLATLVRTRREPVDVLAEVPVSPEEPGD
jgi:hypothetical protein